MVIPSRPDAPLLRFTRASAFFRLTRSTIASIDGPTAARLSSSVFAARASVPSASALGASPVVPACKVISSSVFCRMARARSPFLLPFHRAAALLRASFRLRLATTPLRFANPSPPSGWIEDFHLQAVVHARHTRKSPRTYATTGGLVLLPAGRGRGEGECPTGLRLIWGGRSLLQPHQYVTPTGARGKIGLSGTMQEPDAG